MALTPAAWRTRGSLTAASISEIGCRQGFAGASRAAANSSAMFDHVELPVSDLAASAEFYRLVLAPLGIEQAASGEYVEFGALTLVARPRRENLHLAFIAESRAAVEAFHRTGVAAGYRDNGAPGVRRYASDYFAAYLLDPDGHNIEAVHRSPEARSRWSWLGIGRVDRS